MFVKKNIILSFCFIITAGSFAQLPQDFVIPVKASINEQESSIILSWPATAGASSYIIKRKIVSEGSYSNPFEALSEINSSTDTTFIDNTVTTGVLYEYELTGNFPSLTPSVRNNYFCAGINVPAKHKMGTIILVCDNTIAPSLEIQLSRLYEDLVADGWKVKRLDVNRSSDPADAAGVRNKIIELYHLNPDTKQVFIIGHVPVPYSGAFNPDGHSIHYGAWPADGYYGDMVNNNWTDTANYSYYPTTRVQNINLKGDGKFDQNKFQSVQLAVGRVDFANMPTFGLSEITLLARYLNKDHLFRQGTSTIFKRGLIEDNFSTYEEKFPQIAWKSYSANTGYDNISVGQYETGLLTSGGYLWSYGTGAGAYNNCSGIASTNSFAANSYNTVFTQLFGSYFGDWDSQDNLLRAAIASQGSILTSVWSGRPFWYFHHMAAGYPIGYSALLTVNNKGTYFNTGYGYNMTHIGLMGDPSLKSNYSKPVSNLSADVNKTIIELNWNAPSQTNTQGYNVYRSNSIANDFTLLNDTPLTNNNFTDFAPPLGKNVYMVRAVVSDTFVRSPTYPNNSTYQSLSKGVFDSVVFSNVLLPVKLESFNARINNCKTELNWKTSLETGIKEYVIEYSNNGINFNTIGVTNASGILKEYSFEHTAASQGKAFYRLKIISGDGKQEYSKTIVLPVNCSKNTALVYPNPVNDILNINVTLQQNNNRNNLSLYDAAGKILYQSPVKNGSNNIDMSRFAKGVYNLKLIMGNSTQNYKIQK